MLSSSIFAQKAELTSAILSFRKQDMESAKSYVDAAEVKLNNGGTLKAKDLGKFWHHKGLVYYSLYDTSKDISLLEAATNAFKYLENYLQIYLEHLNSLLHLQILLQVNY